MVYAYNSVNSRVYGIPRYKFSGIQGSAALQPTDYSICDLNGGVIFFQSKVATSQGIEPLETIPKYISDLGIVCFKSFLL